MFSRISNNGALFYAPSAKVSLELFSKVSVISGSLSFHSFEKALYCIAKLRMKHCVSAAAAPYGCLEPEITI